MMSAPTTLKLVNDRISLDAFATSSRGKGEPPCMITIEEKEPIAVPFKDFKIEDWGDGVRKVADIE
jgi:hypothetical protein